MREARAGRARPPGNYDIPGNDDDGDGKIDNPPDDGLAASGSADGAKAGTSAFPGGPSQLAGAGFGIGIGGTWCGG